MVTTMASKELIVSYAGHTVRGWSIGGLFEITGKFADFFEVRPLAVHDKHPMYGQPVQDWVAGLTFLNGRHLLKSTMVRAWVGCAYEYDAMIEAFLVGKSRQRLLERLLRLGESRFQVRIKATDAKLKPFRSLLASGKRRKRLDVGVCYALVPRIEPANDLLRDLPLNGNDRLVRAQAVAMAGQLRAFEQATLVVPLDDERTVRLVSIPDGQLETALFYSNDLKRGVYRLSKAVFHVPVVYEQLKAIQAKAATRSEDVEVCFRRHLTRKLAIRTLVRDLKENRRALGNIKADAEWLRSHLSS